MTVGENELITSTIMLSLLGNRFKVLIWNNYLPSLRRRDARISKNIRRTFLKPSKQRLSTFLGVSISFFIATNHFRGNTKMNNWSRLIQHVRLRNSEYCKHCHLVSLTRSNKTSRKLSRRISKENKLKA